MTNGLTQIQKRFPNHRASETFLEEIIWPNGVRCPYCGLKNVTPSEGGNRYKCNPCNTSFSITVGTPFHHTRCDLNKWFLSIYSLRNEGDGLTARGLAEKIEVTKDTAWLLIKKIKLHNQNNAELFDKIYQEVKSILESVNKKQ